MQKKYCFDKWREKKGRRAFRKVGGGQRQKPNGGGGGGDGGLGEREGTGEKKETNPKTTHSKAVKVL